MDRETKVAIERLRGLIRNAGGGGTGSVSWGDITGRPSWIDSFNPSNYLTTSAAASLYQTIIDATHQLSADFVDDTDTTHKFVQSSQITSWTGAATLLNDMFTLVTEGNNTYIRANYDFFSVGQVSAAGIGQGGSGGVSYLSALEDVYHNASGVLRQDGTPISNGDILAYDSTNERFYAKAENQSGGSGTLTRVTATGANHIVVTGSPLTSDDGALVIGVANGYQIPTTSQVSSWDAKVSNVKADWNATSGEAQILNRPTLAAVATSGAYSDLMGPPSIPTESTVAGWGFTKNTGTITGITMNGASKGTSGVVDLGTVITDVSGYQPLLTESYQLNPAYIAVDSTHRWWTDALATTLNGKAADTAVVHNSGTESIGGLKTFNDGIAVDTWEDITADGQGLGQVLEGLESDIAAKQSIIDANHKLSASFVSGLAAVATSGSYNDLSHKPTIPQAGTDYVTPETLASDLAMYQPLLQALGSATRPVYVSAEGTLTQSTTYAGGTKVTLNGTAKGGSTASFYAPTGTGTAGQYLVSTGATTKVPAWTTPGSVASGVDALVTGGTVYDYIANNVRLDLAPVSSLSASTDLNTLVPDRLAFTYYAYVLQNGTTAGTNGFPSVNNANGLLTVGTYYGDAQNNNECQIGFSSNGNLYYRYISRYVSEGVPHQSYGQWYRLITADINNYTTIDALVVSGHTSISGNLYPSSSTPANQTIGDSNYVWGRIYANRWYPSANQNTYIEYDSTNGYFVVHGTLVAVGNVVANPVA